MLSKSALRLSPSSQQQLRSRFIYVYSVLSLYTLYGDTEYQATVCVTLTYTHKHSTHATTGSGWIVTTLLLLWWLVRARISASDFIRRPSPVHRGQTARCLGRAARVLAAAAKVEIHLDTRTHIQRINHLLNTPHHHRDMSRSGGARWRSTLIANLGSSISHLSSRFRSMTSSASASPSSTTTTTTAAAPVHLPSRRLEATLMQLDGAEHSRFMAAETAMLGAPEGGHFEEDDTTRAGCSYSTRQSMTNPNDNRWSNIVACESRERAVGC